MSVGGGPAPVEAPVAFGKGVLEEVGGLDAEGAFPDAEDLDMVGFLSGEGGKEGYVCGCVSCCEEDGIACVGERDMVKDVETGVEEVELIVPFLDSAAEGGFLVGEQKECRVGDRKECGGAEGGLIEEAGIFEVMGLRGLCGECLGKDQEQHQRQEYGGPFHEGVTGGGCGCRYDSL